MLLKIQVMFIFNIIIFYEIYKSEREDPFDDEGVFHNKVESEQ